MFVLRLLASLAIGSSLMATITFTAGPVFDVNSTLVANPNAATADGASTIPLTFTARDANNNLVSNVSVALSASGGNTLFGASSGTTDANGLFTTNARSTLAQTETITATFASTKTKTITVRFVPGTASATTSQLIVNPNTTLADNTSTLTAALTLLDAQRNPIAGATPTFTASGSSTTITPSGNTSASGQASASYTSSVAQNENAVVTVQGITLAAPIVFASSGPTQAASTLAASPNSTAGDGSSTLNLIATARDAQGHGVSGISVSLSASGGNNTFGSASGTTLSDGTYTTTLRSTMMQTETITAQFGGSFSETTTVTFTGNANTTTSSLSVNPNTQTVGPGNLITATLTLRDAAANPIAGVTPSWTASGGSNTINSGGATSSSGVASATYSSTLAQNENIQVSAGTASLSAPVTFVAGSPNASTSIIYAIPRRQVANNSNTIAVTATVSDAYGNAVSGQATSFSASGTGTTIAGATSTDGTGSAQATYRTGTIQNQNAILTVAGVSIKTPLVFTDVPAQCTLSISPNSQPADGNSAMSLTTTVTNSGSQAVPNVQVIFSTSGAARSFTPQNVITTAAGQAVTNVTSLFAGSNTFLAQAAGVQCAAQGNFVTRTAYCTGNPNYTTTSLAAGSGNYGVTTGDFNGDGKLDIAATAYYGSTVNVFINSGNGTFASFVSYNTGAQAYGVVAADFNGDGIIDLAVSNYGGSSLSVLLGTGSGTFGSQKTYAAGSAPNAITAADFNGDGTPDLAVSNFTANTVSVLIGTGLGTFQPRTTVATGSYPYGMTTGDYNADGRVDMAVVNNSGATMSVFLGTGAGTFAAQATYSTGSAPAHLATGDLNGDGKQDVAVALGTSKVAVLLGTGTGTFQTAVSYATGANPQFVIVGDFNGDGKQDVALANEGTNTMSVLLGTGSGTLSAQKAYTAGNNPYSLASGDFNNDGKQDLVVANTGPATLSLFLNSCP